jgi:hypothetical protein
VQARKVKGYTELGRSSAMAPHYTSDVTVAEVIHG